MIKISVCIGSSCHLKGSYNVINGFQHVIEKNNLLEWQKKYQNPLEIVDMIGTFIENNDQYKINMWISLDKDVFINVTDQNADKLIRYIYERYPW